jgi:hypothetical protein
MKRATGGARLAFQGSLVVFCGGGFPAAMIEAESLSHKKTFLPIK